MAASLPFILVFGVIYTQLTGMPLQESFLKFYGMLNRLVCMDLCMVVVGRNANLPGMHERVYGGRTGMLNCLVRMDMCLVGGGKAQLLGAHGLVFEFGGHGEHGCDWWWVGTKGTRLTYFCSSLASILGSLSLQHPKHAAHTHTDQWLSDFSC